MLRKDIVIDGIVLEHQEDNAAQLDRIKSYEEMLIELQTKENGIYSAEAD